MRELYQFLTSWIKLSFHIKIIESFKHQIISAPVSLCHMKFVKLWASENSEVLTPLPELLSNKVEH